MLYALKTCIAIQMYFVYFSGGLHVEVGGTNLNVVHEPKIVATVKGEEHMQYEAVSKKYDESWFEIHGCHGLGK